MYLIETKMQEQPSLNSLFLFCHILHTFTSTAYTLL